jgi:periplasmic divalent cation tolerance protein
MSDLASGYCVVLSTTSTEEQAEDLAKKIVSAKLGACVQVQKIKSYYMWKGEANADPECLLIIKARTAQFAELESFIKANHSYETPEIVQLPISAGSAAYFSWMNEVTGA